jgi:hypothetical protein
LLKSFNMTSPRGLSNVKNVFLAPFRGQSLVFGRNQKYIPVASEAASVVTGAAVIGGAAYGAVKAAGAAGVSALASTKAATTAAKSAAFKGNLLRIGAIGAGAGFLAGSLRGKPQSLGQSQEIAPTQDTSPIQGTTSDIAQDAFIGGDTRADITAGRDVFLRQDRQSFLSQDVYNYQAPQQTTTPSLSAYGGQEAKQSGANDFLIPALIIGAALFLK